MENKETAEGIYSKFLLLCQGCCADCEKEIRAVCPVGGTGASCNKDSSPVRPAKVSYDNVR